MIIEYLSKNSMHNRLFSLSHNQITNFSYKSILMIVATTTLLATSPLAQSASLSDLFGDSSSTSTNTTNKKILPVHQAFQVVPTQQGNQVSVHLTVTDGYYAYKDKLKLELPDGVAASPFTFSSQPTFVDDPDFGRVPVFEQDVTATATLTSSRHVNGEPATLKWQGCAKAGLCYPPEKVKMTLTNLVSNSKPIATTDAKSNKTSPQANPATVSPVSSPTAVATANKTNTSPDSKVVATAPTAQNPFILSENTTLAAASSVEGGSPTITAATSTPSMTLPTVASSDNPMVITNRSEQVADKQTTPPKLSDTTANNDPFGLVTHPLWAMVLLFLAGLGLAFTACVLPMLPIVANIIARQHNPSAKKGLLLTGGYGLGVATSYGLLGAIIAVFGQSLGIMNWLQNPVILLSFATFFVLLGLYMLDVLPVRLPAKMSLQLNKLTQIGENRLGSVTGSFITGFFSALVVSPCVSAPLAGALAGVATTGNPILGFFALFMLGLGLSTPLILLGATQGNFMPKSGAWMAWVKTGFALLLFAVALLMLERVFITSWMLGLWAIWFAVVAVWAWQWQARGKILTKALAFILGVWAVCLTIGMASGATDSWQPLKPVTAKNQAIQNTQTHTTQRITTLAELSPIVLRGGKVLVDVTADWCIECRIMDKNLFANPPASLQDWQVVKLDVTEDTPESRAIYKELNVFGPPVLLYYQNGKLVHRQNGEVGRADFEQALAKF